MVKGTIKYILGQKIGLKIILLSSPPTQFLGCVTFLFFYVNISIIFSESGWIFRYIVSNK